jgi:hypothetical protein
MLDVACALLDDALVLLAAEVVLVFSEEDVDAFGLDDGRVMVTFGRVTGAEVAEAHCARYARPDQHREQGCRFIVVGRAR